MSFLNIQSALAQRLDALVGLPTIYWPGTKETPTHGTDWVRPTVLPATSELLVLDGTQDDSGVYQIDVFIDAGRGEGPLLTIIDNIRTHFKASTTLTQSGTDVFINSVSVSQIEQDNAWLKGSVLVTYKSIQ